MIELTLICLVMCNVHRLMNDQDSTWMVQVSGLRKELLPSLPKAEPTQSLVVSPAPRLLVSWSELALLRPEDFDLILLGPWGIDLIPCLLSLRGRLWITPRELQLHSLHWTSCQLCGVIFIFLIVITNICKMYFVKPSTIFTKAILIVETYHKYFFDITFF